VQREKGCEEESVAVEELDPALCLFFHTALLIFHEQVFADYLYCLHLTNVELVWVARAYTGNPKWATSLHE
jgi:hypothetical protein